MFKFIHWLSIRWKIQFKSLSWPLRSHMSWPHLLLLSMSLNLPHILHSLMMFEYVRHFQDFVLCVLSAWNLLPQSFPMDYFLYLFWCQPKCYFLQKVVLDHIVKNIWSGTHIHTNTHICSPLFLFLYRTSHHLPTLHMLIYSTFPVFIFFSGHICVYFK